MSKTVLDRPVQVAGAALALVLGMGLAEPVQARGIVADQAVSDLPGVNTCSTGASPNCAPYNFNGTDIYIYRNGIISLTNPLNNPSTSSLPNSGNYFAAGLFDYSTVGGATLKYLLNPDSSPTSALELFWIINAPTAEQALLGIELFDNGNGTFNVTMDYGMDPSGWFKTGNGYSPYCDAVCAGPPGDQIGGVFLPDGAFVGSSYSNSISVSNSGSDAFTYPQFEFDNVPAATTTRVPEPDTWAIMAFGLLSLSLLARRGRKRA